MRDLFAVIFVNNKKTDLAAFLYGIHQILKTNELTVFLCLSHLNVTR